MKNIQELLKLTDKYSYGLSLYRVILSLIVIKNCIFYLPLAHDLFGPNAIVSMDSYRMMSVLSSVPILPFEIPYFSHFILISIILAAIAFMSGFFGRIAGVLLFFLLAILQIRNGFILDGSDNVILVTLPFLVLADSYKYFSYKKGLRLKIKNDIWKDKLLQIGKTVMFFATVALMVQVSYIYFFTAIHKLQGDAWLNGTAVFYTMRVEEFRATSLNIPLTENHYFVVLATYFTILWELSFIFLVWFRQTRIAILVLGVLLHLGILIFMRIDNFSTIMVASYLVFLPNVTYQKLGSRAEALIKMISNRTIQFYSKKTKILKK